MIENSRDINNQISPSVLTTKIIRGDLSIIQNVKKVNKDKQSVG